MNMTSADDALKIICALLVIAVIYCLVEMARYWHRGICLYIYLIEQPPPNEDCPICFLPVPFMTTGSKYQTCCGKMICSGCIYAVQMIDCDAKCPFCRVPMPKSDEEYQERAKNRVEMDDANAIADFGCYYATGKYGFPQDWDKALELFHRAGELGCSKSYYNIGHCYFDGEGLERDIEKAKYYWELAAIGGHTITRYNIGCFEKMAGNINGALKHYMIAVGCGDIDSLKKIRELYMNGHATKDDYAKALRAHQKYIEGIKSNQRDEAAAFDSDDYRYY